MIELTLKGACKNCFARSLVLLYEHEPHPVVACKHESVCKFITDPDGAEKMKAARMAERGNDEIDKR